MTDVEMGWALVGIASVLLAVLAIIVVTRHSRKHADIDACFDLVQRIMSRQLKDELKQAMRVMELEYEVERLADIPEIKGTCIICGKIDFRGNLTRLRGTTLNKIGLVPLKGALTYDADTMYMMHADCAGIRTCSSVLGWEKIPGRGKHA